MFSFKINIVLGILVVCNLFCFSMNGQSMLDTKLSININEQAIEAVFKEIEDQCEVRFAYNPSIFEEDKLVTITVENQTLEYVLNQILGKDITYKLVGKHLVLQLRNAKQEKGKSDALKGTVFDDEGNLLDGAIVFSLYQNKSTISNNGAFSLKIKNDLASYDISISHPNFKDTLLHFTQTPEDAISVYLTRFEKDTLQFQKFENKSISKLDIKPINNIGIVDFVVPEEKRYISSYLPLLETVPGQVSVIPSISTNALHSGTVKSKISLNVLGGYTAGVDGIELGGLFNINLGGVNGLQAAGLFNILGESVNGLQTSGIYNLSQGNMRGLQAAGVVNTTLGKVDGMQVSGLLSYAGSDANIQISGLQSVAKNNSIQVSGLGNTSKSTKGVQIAGVYNIADSLANGIQVSGVFNKTKLLKGVQVGLVNYSDTIENGLPIGLVNITRKGYQRLQIETNELYYADVALKTGSEHIYSILKVGAGSISDVGFGIGFQSSPYKTVALNLDMVASAAFDTERINEANLPFYGGLFKTSLSLGFNLRNGMGCYLGPSFNIFVPNSKDLSHLEFHGAIPEELYYGQHIIQSSYQDGVAKAWLGWQFGFRF